MPGRYEYKVKLVCEACGAKGQARVSESRILRDGDPDLRIESLTTGFIVHPGMRSSWELRIVCETCGDNAWH